jgi:phosphopentomutase/2,3-bisphosphoglycerate-independent phosphoglycerate mutase family metalloenzyme
VHPVIRRLAVVAVLALPVVLIGRAGATWGAASATSVPPREARSLEVSPPASDRGGEDRSESAVVLVVLDGVRWQEVFGGADRALVRPRLGSVPLWTTARSLMPNLYALIDNHAVALGAPDHGPEIAVTGPQRISLPGYLEIFDGRPDAACESNDCPRPPARSMADDVYDESGPDDVAVIASWPNIARAASADPSRFVLTTGRKHVERAEALRADSQIASLLDAGARLGPSPGEGDYRPDAITQRIALRYLAVGRPRFLFVGLGDADEYGHRSDYHGYLAAMHSSDAFLGELVATLGRMGARGRHTTVIVTTDHGRASNFRDHGARYPESGRVWLVAGGGDVHGRGVLVTPARRHTLSDVAPTVRALLGIAGGEGEPLVEVIAR